MPDKIKAPAGEKVAWQAHALGSQIYAFNRHGVRMAPVAAHFGGTASLENYPQNRFQHHPIKESLQ